MKSIRGVQDFFYDSAAKLELVINAAKSIANQHNFHYLKVPIIEKSELFERNIGNDTDIVSKEIYKFLDKAGEDIALRPEFTAGVVRSFCENHELNRSKMPIKLFSHGPLFRYERPQSGRYREFNQINFEVFGKNSYDLDVEILLIASNILQALNIKNFNLKLNFIGGENCKIDYINYLNEYFDKYKNELSADSLKRLESGKSLRILDSKDENDQKISSDVQPISNFYTDNSKQNIDKILETLTSLNVDFTLENNLVRGLDYYTDMVFEFTGEDLKSKSQKAIIGGGRYDKMISQISENKIDIPAIGFASGVERLMELIEYNSQESKKIALIAFEEKNLSMVFRVQNKIHTTISSHATEIFNHNNLSKSIKHATERGFDLICIIGENEEKNNQFQVKNLTTKDIQFTINL